MSGKQAALKLNIGIGDNEATKKVKALTALARREQSASVAQMARETTAANRIALSEERVQTQVTKTLAEQAKARKANAQAIKAEADAQRSLNRELTKRPQQSGFQRAIYSSRFSLPGTNGNIMPLIGQTARGGVGAVAGMAAVGLAGLASQGVARAIRNAGELEAALNRLQGRTGATEAQMDKLRETARGLGNDLTLPGVNSNDAALAIERLASKGLSLQDSMDGAKGALQLATVGSLDFAEAADITADALNAFGLAGSDATKVADAFAAATVKSGTPVKELYDALRQVGPVARQTGLSLNETLAVLSQFGRNGLRGSDAGTSMKTFLLALTAPTKDAKKELAALGVAIYNARGEVRPYRAIVEDLAKALGNMSEKQRNAAMRTIFGTDAIRAAGIVVRDGTKGFDDMAKAVNKVGEAQRQTEAQTRGLKGALEGFNSTLDYILEKKASDSGLVKLLTEVVNLGTQGISTLDSLLTYAMKLGDSSVFGQIIENMKRMRQGMADADAERNNPKAFKVANMASDLKQAQGLLANGDQRGKAGLLSAPLPASPLWERYGVKLNVWDQNASIKELITKIESEQKAAVAEAAEIERLKGRSTRENKPIARGAGKGKPDPESPDKKAAALAAKRAQQKLDAIARSAEKGAKRAEEDYRNLLDDYDGRSTVTLQGRDLAPNPEGEIKRMALVKSITELRQKEEEAAKKRLESEQKNNPEGALQRYNDSMEEIAQVYEKRSKAIRDKDSDQLKKIEGDKAEAEITRMQTNLSALEDTLKQEVEKLGKELDPTKRDGLFSDALESAEAIRQQKLAIADARLKRAKRGGGPLEGALAEYDQSKASAGREYDDTTTGDIIDARTKGANDETEKMQESWKAFGKMLEMAEKKTQEEKRLASDLLDYNLETGAVTTAEYIAELDKQMQATKEYSEEWIALARRRNRAEEEGKDKEAKAWESFIKKVEKAVAKQQKMENARQKYFDRVDIQLADSIGSEVGDSIAHLTTMEDFLKGWSKRIEKIFSDVVGQIISDWARVQLIGGARAGVPGLDGGSLFNLASKAGGGAGGGGAAGTAGAAGGGGGGGKGIGTAGGAIAGAAVANEVGGAGGVVAGAGTAFALGGPHALAAYGIAVGVNTLVDRIFGKKNPFRKVLPHFARGGRSDGSPFIGGEGGLPELWLGENGGMNVLPVPGIYSAPTPGRVLSHQQVAEVANGLRRQTSSGGGVVHSSQTHIENFYEASDSKQLETERLRKLSAQSQMA